MGSAVSAPVTQIDPTDERDLGTAVPLDHHELLVVGATPPDALVEQELSAGLVHRAGELDLRLLLEAHDPRMRPPEEASHLDPSPHQAGEQLAERDALDDDLVFVASPVGDEHAVPTTEPAELLAQSGEVRGAVDQRDDPVAARPASPPRELG